MAKQYGAVPFRIQDGGVEVMLITSRATRRWLVPKGWPTKRGARHTARREAFEESGVTGKLHRKPLGSLTYMKALRKGSVPVNLELYPLAVKKQARDFPERGERTRRWFSLDEAMKRCGDPALRRLMRKLRDRVSSS